VRSSSAKLNAQIDPEGDPGITDCHFEWGESVSYGNTAPCQEGNSFAAPANVTAKLSDLTAGATYHFRIVTVTTSNGTVEGADQSFTTYHGPVALFGSDGTSSTSFSDFPDAAIAFQQATRRLYVVDLAVPGIFGFNASSAPSYTALPGFAPLGTPPLANQVRGFAVDNTQLGSAGNLYYLFASVSNSELTAFGFNSNGSALSGFPVEPGGEGQSAAVDSTGHLWIANGPGGGANEMTEFAPTGGNPIRSVVLSGTNFGGIAFDSSDNLFALASDGVWKFTAASDYTSGSLFIPDSGFPKRIAVDPSNDRIYVAHPDGITEHDAGGALIDEFASGIPGANFRGGLAVDATNHYVYVADLGSNKVRVFDAGAVFPVAKSGAASDIANFTAVLNGTVNPRGTSLIDCRFEYVSELAFNATGFEDLDTGGNKPCVPDFTAIPADFDAHAVSAQVGGLATNTTYRFRLSASSADGTARQEGAFTTTGRPIVETTGAPLRGTASALLGGRVDPVRATATYHFEYGSEGPCDVSPCLSTSDQAAGSGDSTVFVDQSISGLAPGTTYHYRVVADNGNEDGPAVGGDMTVTTRVSEDPLTHGRFPGPPGSDRAYEHVGLADTAGVPIFQVGPIADDGNSAIYGVAGGTPISNSGTIYDRYYAERGASGWRTSVITPARDELNGDNWGLDFLGSPDSALINMRLSKTGEAPTLWRLVPSGQPEKLFEPSSDEQLNSSYFGASGDAAHAVVRLKGGTPDPAYPAAAAVDNLYGVSPGAGPRLLSLLPGNVVAACGIDEEFEPAPASHWLSEDGSQLVFASRGNGPCNDGGAPRQLYLRDVVAASTTLISAPVISGPSCQATLLKAIPGSVFFWTRSRLSAEDKAVASCGPESNGDIYRYDIADGAQDCVTCVVSGLDADIEISRLASEAVGSIGASVSEDGSRLYFSSKARLLPEAPGDGQGALYRVVVATGDLALVAPSISVNEGTLSRDGSLYYFPSSRADLNAVGGLVNGGTTQMYRYDDRDRSLLCISCPTDGSAPLGASQPPRILGSTNEIAEDGTYAFTTPTPLLAADQNTHAEGIAAGTDVYEWRDGRHFLVTDGLTSWAPKTEPVVNGVSRTGRDIFFTAFASYTPDAVDEFGRLYDARVGGGFEVPPSPKPCPLEVCQGIPAGAPEEAPSGTSTFAGPTTKTAVKRPPRCPKGKRRTRKGTKARCVRRHDEKNHRKANNDRGAQR